MFEFLAWISVIGFLLLDQRIRNNGSKNPILSAIIMTIAILLFILVILIEIIL